MFPSPGNDQSNPRFILHEMLKAKPFKLFVLRLLKATINAKGTKMLIHCDLVAIKSVQKVALGARHLVNTVIVVRMRCKRLQGQIQPKMLNFGASKPRVKRGPGPPGPPPDPRLVCVADPPL